MGSVKKNAKKVEMQKKQNLTVLGKFLGLKVEKIKGLGEKIGAGNCGPKSKVLGHFQGGDCLLLGPQVVIYLHPAHAFR